MWSEKKEINKIKEAFHLNYYELIIMSSACIVQTLEKDIGQDKV